MTRTLSWTTLAVAVLLLLGQATGQDLSLGNSTCLPDTPENVANGTVMLLKRVQWSVSENITQPDWNPENWSDDNYYEYLQPGVVMTRPVQLIKPVPNDVNVSYVSDGDTLCLAVLTQYGNKSTESSDWTETCTRVCHKNFNKVDLPLLVLDDWTRLRRTKEILTFESLDPEVPASYFCMGHFSYKAISDLPELFSREMPCRHDNDKCLFQYNKRTASVTAGCRLSAINWDPNCVSNLTDCGNADYCSICCSGDYCNRAMAMQFYQNWLLETTTTMSPTTMFTTTTKRAGFARVPSLWALTALPLTSLLAWLLLLQR